MKTLFNKPGLVKNIATLMSGTIIAQTIPICMQVVLRRLYSDADFGAFAIFNGIIGIGTILSALRYDQCIVIPEKDEDSVNIVCLTFIFAAIINILFGIFLFFGINWFADILNFPKKYVTYLYLLPIAIFLFSSYSSLNYYLIRKKMFKASSVNKIFRRISESISQVSFGISWPSFGLLISNVIGNLINLCVGVFQLKNIFNHKKISKFKMKENLIAYHKLSIFNIIPSLLNIVSLYLPVFLINKFYNESVTGQLDLCRMVLALPIALITTSVGQGLLQYISECRNRKKSIQNEVKKIFYFLFLLFSPFLLLLIFFSVELFVFVFGSNWELAGKMTTVLIFSYFVKFLVSPFSNVLVGLKKIRIVSVWQTFYFGCVVVLFFVEKVDLFVLLKSMVFIDLFCYVIFGILIFFQINKYEKSVV